MINLVFFCFLLHVQVEAKDHQVNCSFTFNVSGEQENYFNSPGFPVPGYTNNLECTYKFRAPVGSKVKVEFLQGTTERCCDKIEAISEGSLGFYSFSLDHREVISRKNNLTLIFRTDKSVTLRGFNASYRLIQDVALASVQHNITTPQTTTSSIRLPQDCNFTFTVNGDEKKYFNSPDFPFPGYRNNLECTYKFITLPGRRIEIEFVEGKTEYCCDKIEAISAGSVSFHGGVLDETELFSRDNHLTLSFKTDHSVKFKGFNASYSSKAITCYPSITAPTNGEVSCINRNKLSSVCTYTCNEGYTLSNNSLTNLICNDDGDSDGDGEWSSQPPQCIDVDECTFGAHDCDGNATCTNTDGGYTCECNKGFIGNGLLCEDVIKQTVDVCGDDEPQGYNGFLTSPNFPRNYGNYHDCSKLLSPPVGKRVEIGFLIFEIEDGDGSEEGKCLYDSLTVIVGDEEFSGVKYCGNVVPYNFTTDQEVTFNFLVDHSKSLQGFKIFWKMVDDCDERSFRCWDGSCIPTSKRCNGIPDCPNQRDEIGCVHPTSSYGECGKNSAPAQFVWEKHTNRRESLLQRKSRIVGGHSARSKSYPWTVPLFIKNETNQIYICVASIISERWLMTAAHCVNGRSERELFGLVGTNNKSDFDSTKILFGTIVTHPNYSENRMFLIDDIALLRTTKPITFGDQVNPVCIPNQDVPPSEIGIVIGWGLFYKGSTRYPDLLHQIALPLLNNSLCRRAYPQKTEEQICAGDFENGGRDTCQGDSGGPLLCFKDNSWFQFGITSTGAGCGKAKSPGIYTDVRSYYAWIQQEIQPCKFTFNVSNKEENQFNSPRFPSHYYNFLNCTYSFVAPRGRKIKIKFIEGRTEKCCDKIKIISEETTSFSGELSGKEMISRDNSLIINFETDRSTTDKGFKAYYRLL